MATIVKTPSGTWKAVIRKTGWPTASKTFRTKRDAEDWARRTEDEMVRGVYIQRAPGERMTVEAALKRYLREVTPTKRESTRVSEQKKAQPLLRHLGKYLLAALSADIVAQYRDMRLAGDPDENGKPVPRSNNTVRLELALLSHLFTVAIKEWGMGLPFNPVSQIRRPAPGAGRNRRLAEDYLVSYQSNRYSVPFGLIGKEVQVTPVGGMLRVEYGGAIVAEHPLLAGRHQMRILPEHGPGAVARNSRQRFSPPGDEPSNRWWGPAEVQVRDPRVYEEVTR